MDPGRLVHKPLQELGGRDRPCKPATNIFHIGTVSFQKVVRPVPVASAASPEAVPAAASFRKPVIIAEETGIFSAKHCIMAPVALPDPP